MRTARFPYRTVARQLSLAVAVVLPALLACDRSHSPVEAEKDALVTVGDSTLRLSDVVRSIPVGLSPEDSLRMFHNIVNSWVDGLVLTNVAQRNIPDMQRIDRMVQEYRNNLIINEYMRLMSEQGVHDADEKTIKDYYLAHADEFVLDQPLVKGAFIRVDEADSQLSNLRRWLADFSDDSFDNIERSGLRHATAYEYFGDMWHEWSDVAEKIPYRFFDADAFVKSTKDFETTYDGSVYLLHISEFVPSGDIMPYEFARINIAEMMRVEDINASRTKLKADIYRRMIKDGMLKPGLYDPVKGEMRKDKQVNKDNSNK